MAKEKIVRLKDVEGHYGQKFYFKKDKSRGINVKYMIISDYTSYLTAVNTESGTLFRTNSDDRLWDKHIVLVK